MSGQLESALVLELVDTIRWGSALGPVDSTGVLTQVDIDAPIDVTQYARRDRELSYRDVINAAAILKVSLEVETVWNSAEIRPRVQGLTTDIMPYIQGDIGQVNSAVAHVKQTSVPKDAIVADKDLAGRDALAYEVLARACQIFSDPPLTPQDASGTVIPDTAVWSLGEATTNQVDISPSVPLNRELFKGPDTYLAGRDNEIAAYVANLTRILRNPFEFATRLYVRIDGADEREIETYAFIREYWDQSVLYQPDDEVFYGDGWWRASSLTKDVPGETPAWRQIDGPTERIFIAEPAYTGRNRIIYNSALKTLRWISETATDVHPPQICALSIPGALPGQTITTVPQVPQASDAQFWRQKASRISYEGTLTNHLFGFLDSTVIRSGQAQTDTIGFTGPGAITIPFPTVLVPKNKYRFTSLVKPSQTIDIYGANNVQTLSGTLNGATFLGPYAPTVTGSPGRPISYAVTLPAGNWTAALEYTNLGVTTEGFGCVITVDGAQVMADTSPLLFQDSNGNQYPRGRLVESAPVAFTSSGAVATIGVQWTYGDGAFHVRTLKLETRDRNIGRYSMQLDVQNTVGVSMIPQEGTTIPAIDSFGERRQYYTMPFEFEVTGTVLAPRVIMNWLPVGDGLPLQTREFQLEQVVRTLPVPEVGGFLGWKQECLDRAGRVINTSYNQFLSLTSDADIPNFTVDGTLWDSSSTEKWMSTIETYQPRLREVQGIQTVVDGRQYLVYTGVVVYNGGTYTAGQKFYGTDVPTFLGYNSPRLDQVGAFTISYPGHVGKPGLMPAGLYFDGRYVKQANPTKTQIPVITTLQPWMIEAGLYVAQRDFWSPDTIQSGIDAEGETIDRYPTTLVYTGGIYGGSFDDFVFTEEASTMVELGTGEVDDVIIEYGGTDTGTASFMSLGTGYAQDVVFYGTGTDFGTAAYLSLGTGYAQDVVFTFDGTDSGTAVFMSLGTGYLFDQAVSAGLYSSDGTLSGGFLTGAYV